MLPLFLDKESMQKIEYELVPLEAKQTLTRLLRGKCLLQNREATETIGETHFAISFQNDIINRANNIIGRKPYILLPDDHGMIHEFEFIWHRSEFEACIQRLPSYEFLEFLAEITNDRIVDIQEANSLLESFGSTVSLQESGGTVRLVVLEAVQDEDLPEDSNEGLQQLVRRMQSCLNNNDAPGVLHAASSALELLAKDELGESKLNSKPFGKIAKKYKENSSLPTDIIEWVEKIYVERNREPQAGHGTPDSGSFSIEDASLLSELTKALARHHINFISTIR